MANKPAKAASPDGLTPRLRMLLSLNYRIRRYYRKLIRCLDMPRERRVEEDLPCPNDSYTYAQVIDALSIFHGRWVDLGSEPEDIPIAWAVDKKGASFTYADAAADAAALELTGQPEAAALILGRKLKRRP